MKCARSEAVATATTAERRRVVIWSFSKAVCLAGAASIGTVLGCAGTGGSGSDSPAKPPVTQSPATGYVLTAEPSAGDVAQKLRGALPSTWRSFASNSLSGNGLDFLKRERVVRLVRIHVDGYASVGVNYGSKVFAGEVLATITPLFPEPSAKFDVKRNASNLDPDEESSFWKGAAATLVSKVDQLPSLSAEEVDARTQERDEAPVRRPLAEARRLQQAGDLARAWAQVNEAMTATAKVEHLKEEVSACQEEIRGLLVDQVVSRIGEVDGFEALRLYTELATVAGEPLAQKAADVRPSVFDKAVKSIRESFGDAAKLEPALAALDALKKAMPDRTGDLAAVERESVEPRRRAANALADEAAAKPRLEYAASQQLAERALRLDPTNAKAKSVLETVRQISAELRPTFITGLRTQKDGAGLKVVFSLKNKAEQFTAVPGRATVRFEVVDEVGNPVSELDTVSYDVTVDNYKKRGETVFVELPRIAYDSLEDPWTTYGVGSQIFKETLRDNRCRVSIEIYFTAAGEQRVIAESGTLTYHAF